MSDFNEGMSNLDLNDEAKGPAKVWATRDEQRAEIANRLEVSGWNAKRALIEPGTTWAAKATRYEWLDDYGTVAPAMPELEEQLFHSEHTTRMGPNFDGLDIAVTVESEEKVKPVLKFEDAGLHPVVIRNVQLCRYARPTPIQSYSLPTILTNHDLIAVAQTGSGKTAAFLIPILSKLMGKAAKLRAPRPAPRDDFDAREHGVTAEPLVLIIVPTRELGIQTFDECRRLCYRSMLRPCVVYGGGPPRDQREELAKGCDILIGTPGRLIDFLSNTALIKLSRVKYTVIDEADEMVSADWVDDMRTIFDMGDLNTNADHHYMLFSATFPNEARQLAKIYLSPNHVRIRVGRIGSSHRNIKQTVIETHPSEKENALRDLVLSLPATRTLIFVNRRETADLVDDYLHHLGFPSTSIHSDRPQRQREDAIAAFRAGTTPLLVATPVSARGLDITNIMHVVNYDMPASKDGVKQCIAEYVHRIGRTARIGHQGFATSFFTERDQDLAPMLLKLLKETDQVIPEFLAQFAPPEDEPLDFEDQSEEEGEGAVAGGDAGGDGWGDGGDDAGASYGGDAGGSNWGASNAEPASDAAW